MICIMKIAENRTGNELAFILLNGYLLECLSLLMILGGITLAEHEKNRISVEIYGHTYKMVGTETTGHMRLVASIVDDKMREISVHNPSLDSTRLAVLTAVNSVHELLQLKERVEVLEEELKKIKG